MEAETSSKGASGGKHSGGDAEYSGLGSIRGIAAPWRLKSFIRMALWKKLPVNARLVEKEIKDMDKCPLCQMTEDHGHRLKKCQFLDIPGHFLIFFWPFSRGIPIGPCTTNP
mmetsp:Transcript_89411/g.154846  ORF Transcript_89411/g.154846 Transcript_89411/m.154846 type:complete len:112 (-) Transcript_89411:25-360(-)